MGVRPALLEAVNRLSNEVPDHSHSIVAACEALKSLLMSAHRSRQERVADWRRARVAEEAHDYGRAAAYRSSSGLAHRAMWLSASEALRYIDAAVTEALGDNAGPSREIGSPLASQDEAALELLLSACTLARRLRVDDGR